MKQQTTALQLESPHKCDIGSLFSRFHASQTRIRYQEIQRQQAAGNALTRWPLLAEIQGLDGAPAD